MSICTISRYEEEVSLHASVMLQARHLNSALLSPLCEFLALPTDYVSLLITLIVLNICHFPLKRGPKSNDTSM